MAGNSNENNPSSHNFLPSFLPHQAQPGNIAAIPQISPQIPFVNVVAVPREVMTLLMNELAYLRRRVKELEIVTPRQDAIELLDTKIRNLQAKELDNFNMIQHLQQKNLDDSNRIKELENLIDNLQNENSDQQSNVEALTRLLHFNSVEHVTKVENLKTEITELRKLKLMEVSSDLQNRNIEPIKEIEKLKNTIAALKSNEIVQLIQVKNLTTDIENLKREIERLKKLKSADVISELKEKILDLSQKNKDLNNVILNLKAAIKPIQNFNPQPNTSSNIQAPFGANQTMFPVTLDTYTNGTVETEAPPTSFPFNDTDYDSDANQPWDSFENLPGTSDEPNPQFSPPLFNF